MGLAPPPAGVITWWLRGAVLCPSTKQMGPFLGTRFPRLQGTVTRVRGVVFCSKSGSIPPRETEQAAMVCTWNKSGTVL